MRHDPPPAPRRAASVARWNLHEKCLHHAKPLVQHEKLHDRRRLHHAEPLVPQVTIRGQAPARAVVFRKFNLPLVITSTSTWLITWSESNEGRLWNICTSFQPQAGILVGGMTKIKYYIQNVRNTVIDLQSFLKNGVGVDDPSWAIMIVYKSREVMAHCRPRRATYSNRCLNWCLLNLGVVDSKNYNPFPRWPLD